MSFRKDKNKNIETWNERSKQSSLLMIMEYDIPIDFILKSSDYTNTWSNFETYAMSG